MVSYEYALFFSSAASDEEDADADAALEEAKASAETALSRYQSGESLETVAEELGGGRHIAAPADAPSPSRGYRPWAAGDRHELLVWVRTDTGEICGFEFETMRFLADLSATWHESPYSRHLGMRNTWRRTARQAAPRLLGSLHDPSGTPLIPPVAATADQAQ